MCFRVLPQAAGRAPASFPSPSCGVTPISRGALLPPRLPGAGPPSGSFTASVCDHVYWLAPSLVARTMRTKRACVRACHGARPMHGCSPAPATKVQDPGQNLSFHSDKMALPSPWGQAGYSPPFTAPGPPATAQVTPSAEGNWLWTRPPTSPPPPMGPRLHRPPPIRTKLEGAGPIKGGPQEVTPRQEKVGTSMFI